MKSVRINVEVSSEAEEAVSYILIDMGSGGVQIESLNSRTDLVVVSAYFPLDDNVGERVFKLRQSIDQMQELMPDFGKAKISIENIDDKDWSEDWKSFFKPLLIGKRMVVYPTWENIDHIDRDVHIQIDPGMAFGTGKHATTMLSLVLLEKVINGGEKVADIGTGSGILSIASIKLGADSVTAVDIDPNAVEIAIDNANINRAGNKIRFMCSDIIYAIYGKYDVIVSNIHTKILLPMIPQVASYLKSGSYFILSGILETESHIIESELSKNNYIILEKPQQEEWIAFLAKVP